MQRAIIGVAQGTVDPYGTQDHFQKILGPGYDLYDRAVEAANSTPSYHVALMPSLFVWSTTQPWFSEHQENFPKAYLSQCLGSRSSSATIVAANLFMAQLLPLVDTIPQEYQTPLLSDFLHRLYKFTNPWTNPPGVDLARHYLELTHHLTQKTYEPEKAISKHDVWCSKVVSAISQTPNPDDLWAALAASSIAPQSLYHALKHTGGKVWSLPSVAAFLTPLLPTLEQDIFPLLPWERNPAGVALNRALLQRYCPNAYPLVDLATPQAEDWLDPKRIAAWLPSEKPLDQCPMPVDFLDSPSQ